MAIINSPIVKKKKITQPTQKTKYMARKIIHPCYANGKSAKLKT
jgi:hypothetical protein